MIISDSCKLILINFPNANIYIVGGAIRDYLLNKNINEIDYVITGISHESMIKLGFKQLYNTPVYIDNHGNEFSLARIETKVSNGYNGFKFDCNKNITIEQDLARRDITINSIAYKINLHDNVINIDKLIDPFNGVKDLYNKVIRHINNKFIDDPLRLIRLARFYSYLYEYNFNINTNTFQLIEQIIISGSLQHIKKEKIFKETNKVLSYYNSNVFFRFLFNIKAMDKIYGNIFYESYKELEYSSIKINIIDDILLNHNLSNSKLLLILYKIVNIYAMKYQIPELHVIDSLSKQIIIEKYIKKEINILINIRNALNLISQIHVQSKINNYVEHKLCDLVKNLNKIKKEDIKYTELFRNLKLVEIHNLNLKTKESKRSIHKLDQQINNLINLVNTIYQINFEVIAKDTNKETCSKKSVYNKKYKVIIKFFEELKQFN